MSGQQGRQFKSMTTYWPVRYTASGMQTMTVQQVVDVIMDAARLGTWHNAPKGTRLAIYELPVEQAQRFGVSEVKVSAAPDGRILSAYPSAGWNVYAVKVVPQQQPQMAAPVTASGMPAPRRVRPATTFAS